MQRIMEPIFEIAYLVAVILLGVMILRRAEGRKQFRLFGIMAIVLGLGDAFHLVPRIYGLWTGRLAELTAALGFGTLVTSVTMTLFYVMLYHVLRLRYGLNQDTGIRVAVYTLALIRIALCLFPQNRWMDADAPLSWGIYRNIPFACLGILMIFVAWREARRHQDHRFRWLWLAITLSFAFYLPVVLFADAIPLMGMLMIPKTCCYLWIVWMGYQSVKETGNGKTEAKVNQT